MHNILQYCPLGYFYYTIVSNKKQLVVDIIALNEQKKIDGIHVH